MDIKNLMAQAQKMQKAIGNKIAEFEAKEFAYDYKNGSVVVNIKGDFTITKIIINKVLIDPEDANLLQEMVAEAVNAAVKGVKIDRDQIQGNVGGASIPGLF
ncbi:MAG: YbaB/EbfC family nucleoid-associated protein [Mycoplasmataceae bacterium]|jgi:DNA-binding YbaB/EbfC family protein|nr:YbaB/EbfC family nucleoid-associated protein [Mycoplasmataceae bacterium]